MQAVAKAPPDGYTLIFTSVTSLAINVSAYKSLPYDPIRDFAPWRFASRRRSIWSFIPRFRPRLSGS